MEDRIQRRQQAALAVKLAAGHTAKRRDLLDPSFNLREIAKQLLLLEDHLNHPYKICNDCIRKHLMTVEAFAEEAGSMDESGRYGKVSEALAEIARKWLEELSDGKPPKEVAQEIRKIRKNLVCAVHDPRAEEPQSRVAYLYLNRDKCPHKI